MVTMRSWGGMKPERMFSNVVFPLPVPPETSTLSLALTTACSASIIGWLMLPIRTRSSARRRSFGKRRMDNVGPSMASGGMMALMREPSLSLASTIGQDSSMRRPTRETIRSIMPRTWASSLKWTATRSSFPPRST